MEGVVTSSISLIVESLANIKKYQTSVKLHIASASGLLKEKKPDEKDHNDSITETQKELTPDEQQSDEHLEKDYNHFIEKAKKDLKLCGTRLNTLKYHIYDYSTRVCHVRYTLTITRAIGWAAANHFIVKAYQESNQSSLDLIMSIVCKLSISGCLLLYLFPNIDNSIYKDIKDFKRQYSLLLEAHQKLELKMNSVEDFKEIMKNRKN